MKTPSRVLTTFTVGFLILDALLFALAARFVAAGVCAAAAGLVVLGWRRYRRIMTELADARREMKREAEALRDLLQTHLRN